MYCDTDYNNVLERHSCFVCQAKTLTHRTTGSLTHKTISLFIMAGAMLRSGMTEFQKSS